MKKFKNLMLIIKQQMARLCLVLNAELSWGL
jgi:hypothetical protein